MSVYRDGAPGITTRGPGEPCDHRYVVAYSDAYGNYARCKLCHTEFVDGVALRAPQPPPCDLCHGRLIVMVAGPDADGNYDTEDCPCQL